MTIETSIVTALSSVVSGKVYPKAAPQDTAMPFVIYKRTSYEPIMQLTGPEGTAKSVYVFESWGATQSSAGTTRAAVEAAINAAYATLGGYAEDPGESAFDPENDAHMEPCAFSFWHTS